MKGTRRLCGIIGCVARREGRSHPTSREDRGVHARPEDQKYLRIVLLFPLRHPGHGVSDSSSSSGELGEGGVSSSSPAVVARGNPASADVSDIFS